MRENYAIIRDSLNLGSLSDDDEWVEREPTNAEILLLLDALHSDLKGETHPKVDQILTERYWYS